MPLLKFNPLIEGRMQARNEYWDYWLATQLTPLRNLNQGDTVFGSFAMIYNAWQALESIKQDSYGGMELCVEQINKLRSALGVLFPKFDEKAEEPPQDRAITPYEAAQIKEALSAFETALSIQFSQVNTYRVTAKGTHDVRKLISSPSETFGKYWNGMSQMARDDWSAGAKCLAFELATACGFHVVRAMEAVVIDCLKVTKKSPSKGDLGHYVELMREVKIADEAVDIVEQIRKHHRNPLMHPEDILDVPMAMSLYDLSRAAIVSLVADMGKKNLVDLAGAGEQRSLIPIPIAESVSVK